MSSGVSAAAPKGGLEGLIPKVGFGRCPLVLGECIQGRFGDEPHFLVTTPIDLHSSAEFTPRPETSEVLSDPPACAKARRAVERWLEEEGLPPGGLLKIRRPQRPALGFGTSTADITAALRSAAAAYSRPLGPRRISEIAIAIEPSDGSMHPGCVAYAHRCGKLIESFGAMPGLRAFVLLSGEGVDTVTFDKARRDFIYSERDQSILRRAWGLVREAHRTGRIGPMAEAGVMSAKINQQLLFKPALEEALDLFTHVEASGLFIAHTGSLIAFVFDPHRSGFENRWEETTRFLSERLPGEWIVVDSSADADEKATP